MRDPAPPRIGVARKLCGILLYALAGIGGLFAVGGFVTAQASRLRRADTGDFTGAAMLESFVFIFVLPLTVSALIGAWCLLPLWRPRPAAESD